MFKVTRNPHNSILEPNRNNAFEAEAAFNWCPVKDGNTTHFVYRALGDIDILIGEKFQMSTVGYINRSDDGDFSDPTMLISPEYHWERYGCEDPRITKIDDSCVICYTALSKFPFEGSGIKAAMAFTKDFKTIDKRGLVTPFNAKAMAIFPEKVNGKYTAIITVNPDFPPSKIAIAQVENLEDFYNESFWHEWYANLENHIVQFQVAESSHIEVGGVPVLTEHGWMLVYARMDNYFNADKRLFGIHVAFLDKKDPRQVVMTSQSPLLVPEESYELYGMVPNVIFPSGVLKEGDEITIFYGATDTTCCSATVSYQDLVSSMQRTSAVERFKNNPIMQAVPERNWEGKLVFNPGAIEIEDTIYIVYRAMSPENTSMLGLAISNDGYTLNERLHEPIYVPREEFEMKKKPPTGFSGCEDPRLTRIGDGIHMLYTAYDGVNAPRVAATQITVEDFLRRNWEAWSEPRLVSPAGIDDKDACLFPETFGGKYLALHRVAHHICGDYIDSLDEEWVIDTCQRVIAPRKGMWDGEKVGIAGPPHKTEKGWLLLYHGVSSDAVYRVGAVLLDLENPFKVLGRTTNWIFAPEEKYELIGDVNNVVFLCGSVIRDDTLFIYYGGADEVVGGATIALSRLLEVLNR